MPRTVRAVAMLFLLLDTGAFTFVDRYIYGEWEGKPGDKFTQTLNLLFIGTSIWLFVRGFRGGKSIRFGMVLALAVPVYMVLSSFWSFEPATTTRRAAEYLFVVLGAVGCAGCIDGDDFMEMLALTCGLSAIMSLVLREIDPRSAFMDFLALRGVFPHKNVLGQFMAAGALATIHCLGADARGRLRNVCLLILFLIVALMAKSTTAILAAVTYCSAGGVMILCRKGGLARVFALLGVVLLVPVGLLFALSPDTLFQLVGKDATLSGRTEVWAYCWNDIAQRPMLGWGYYAFWSPHNPLSAEITEAVQWPVPEAHNGFLELLLDVGAVGTAFMIFLLIRNFWFALRALFTPDGATAITSLLCYLGIVLVGVSESIMIEPFQPTTLLFFTTGLMCEKAVRTARRRRRFGVHQPLLAGRAQEVPLPAIAEM